MPSDPTPQSYLVVGREESLPSLSAVALQQQASKYFARRDGLLADLESRRMERASSRPGAATNADQHLPYKSRLDPWVWDQVEELLPKKPKNMRLGPKMEEHRAYCLNRVLNRVLPRADGAGTASIHEEDIPLLLDVSAPYGERVAGLRELGWEELPTKEEIKLNMLN